MIFNWSNDEWEQNKSKLSHFFSCFNDKMDVSDEDLLGPASVKELLEPVWAQMFVKHPKTTFYSLEIRPHLTWVTGGRTTFTATLPSRSILVFLLKPTRQTENSHLEKLTSGPPPLPRVRLRSEVQNKVAVIVHPPSCNDLKHLWHWCCEQSAGGRLLHDLNESLCP